jgi:hypothetical protein
MIHTFLLCVCKSGLPELTGPVCYMLAILLGIIHECKSAESLWPHSVCILQLTRYSKQGSLVP